MPDGFEFEVTGGPEAYRKIMAKKDKILPALKAEFLDRGRKVQRRLALYPDPPAGSTYRRTGTLGRRWRMRSNFGGGRLYVNVYNLTEYGPYVQGEEYQAHMHRGRWETEVQALEAESSYIVEGISGALIRALR